MEWFYICIARLRALVRREEVTRDYEEEMRLHIEMETEANLERGMSMPEALQAARRRFGNLGRIGDLAYEIRGGGWMDTLWQDLRYGFRQLLKSPGFTAVAVMTLALGIGANTAVFTLINALLLRTLPVTNPHELVAINAIRVQGRDFKGGAGFFGSVSFPMYRDLRARQEVFTDISASGEVRSVRLTIAAGSGTMEVDNVQANLVSASYWSVFGVQPALGRFFSEDEDRNPQSSETAGSLAVLSYSFWERQFGRDPSVLDRTMLVGRSSCRVIGVAPRGFFGERVGSEPDLWVPLVSFSSRNLFEDRRWRSIAGIARLKPGLSREQAQTALTLLYQQLLQLEFSEAPRSNPNRNPAVQDFIIQLVPGATGFSFGRLRQTFTEPLLVIMAIVALVLLIACANVANLLLARAVARQREISVRRALGCGRFRLMRQLLTESLLLSGLGTVAGLFVAWWGSRVLLRLVDTEPVPLRLDLSPDARVLLFTAAVMVLTGIGFGLAPAWRASGFDLASALKDQARGTGARAKQYLGRTLVVFQVALSLVLLIGAGLLIRSLYNLQQIDLGFRPEQVLHFQLAHNPSTPDSASFARVAREVRERVKQIPGVQQVGVSWWVLFSRGQFGDSFKIHDRVPEPGENIQARIDFVSPGYFETVGMSLIAGRGIEDRDRDSAPMTAVINETLARRFFPGGNVIGRIIEIPSDIMKDKPIEIVGVIRDAKYNALRAETAPMIYLSIQQVPRTLGALEVRTTEPLSALAGPVRQALSDVSKDLMIRRAVRLSDQVNLTLASERLLAMLCAFFGALALVLASVGLYGVISYAVAQRTQEIGIRRALGATDRNVLWLMLGQSLTVVLAGIAIGLSLALFSTRLLSSFLFGLSPTDSGAIALSTILLILVALAACWIPARRATKIDPMVALRAE